MPKVSSRLALSCAALVGGLGLAAVEPSTAAELPPAMLAGPCSGCHGPGGNSAGLAMPTLAGMNAKYFLLAMEQFQTDKRNATVMNRIAKGYSRAELETMADYFEGQRIQVAKQPFDKSKVARGKELHDKYCAERCHEKGGASDEGGILAGQWTAHLKLMVSDMREGRTPMPVQMKTRIERLVEEQGEKAFGPLMDYYASQQAKTLAEKK